MLCHQNGVVGQGNLHSEIMFIGSFPAPNESSPFTGRAGQVLNGCLKAIDLKRSDIFLTNVLCKYVENPSKELINECGARLHREINIVKPKVVVAFGELAARYLTNMQLKKIRGAVIWTGKYYLICTYQPASVFYSNGLTIHDIVRDIVKIPAVLCWPRNGSIGNVNYEVIQNYFRAQEILDSLETNKIYSIDIETTSKDIDEKDVFVDKMMCLCIADTNIAYVFPSEICYNLKWPTGPRWAFHNGIFDVQGLKKYLDIWLPICEDTLLMSYSLDERKGRHKLKPLAREYCGASFYEEGVPVGKGNLTKDELNQLYEYNAKDGVYTARLVPILSSKCIDDGVYSVYKSLLLPAANAFAEIQYRGVHIDLDAMRDITLDLFPKWLSMEKELISDARALGFPGDINLNSPRQLSNFIYGILQIPGGPSTDKEHLESIEDEHSYIKKLSNFKKLDKVIGSYILGIRDDIKTDSRVHAQVNLNGTTTGRLSYTKPPLQTIPKPRSDEDVEFLQLRTLFSATNNDYILVETDYEKSEVWGAYAVSHDQHLLEDLNSFDFHTKVASTIYNCDYNDVSERQRFNAKKTTFGIIYGIEDNTLSKQINVSKSEAHQFRMNWFARYRDYFRWAEKTKEILFREGEVVSPTGRKRRFKIFVGEYWKAINQAINMPIQTLSSDITLSSMIKLHYALKPFDSYILWTCHDSIIFEVNKQYDDIVIPLIKQIMTESHFKGIKSPPVEIKIGSRLSEMKKVKV